MEFYSATRSRNNDPGFRGLHRKKQYSSNRISDLSVILRYKIRMGMGQLYERSQRRKRNQIPKMATYLHYLYIPLIVYLFFIIYSKSKVGQLYKLKLLYVPLHKTYGDGALRKRSYLMQYSLLCYPYHVL